MVLLYLDFARHLERFEQALLEKVIKESTQYCSVNECRDVTCNVSTRVSRFAIFLTEQYWESTGSLFGIDPNSTKISLFPYGDNLKGVRARVSFFILGSSENSIEFRKRLLELANESISEKLQVHGIEFTTQEPTIYLESPVSI